jgi:acetone monooxygenase
MFLSFSYCVNPFDADPTLRQSGVASLVKQGRENMSMQVDAIVIGAGVSGLYQIHQLKQQGLKVQGLEAGTDVGGTWYWNRYPGARFDSESYIYQYLFDEDLYKDWTWSERFPAQPEIERWLHYITERLDLRKNIKFSSRVIKANFNEETNRWAVDTDRGESFNA